MWTIVLQLVIKLFDIWDRYDQNQERKEKAFMSFYRRFDVAMQKNAALRNEYERLKKELSKHE